MCYNKYRVSERVKISVTKAKAQVVVYLSFLALIDCQSRLGCDHLSVQPFTNIVGDYTCHDR